MDLKSTTAASIEALLGKRCWVIDILPRRVPAGGEGRYFSVERCFLNQPRFGALRRQFADLLLKLYCYHDLLVLPSPDGQPVHNPEPEALARWVLEARTAISILLESGNALITLDRDDTHAALFNPSETLLCLVRQLAAAQGLFVWESVGRAE